MTHMMPERYCTNCWSMEHPTTACRRQLPRCKLCAGDHRTDDHVCSQCNTLRGDCFCSTSKRCCNCKGQHIATAYDCPERKRKLGQFAKKTAAPAKRAPAASSAVPKTATASSVAAPETASASTEHQWQKVPPAGGRKTRKKSQKSKEKDASQPPPPPATPAPAQSGRKVRRSHSDPHLTPRHPSAAHGQKKWSEDVDVEMDAGDDAGDAASLYQQPFPTGDQDTPDL